MKKIIGFSLCVLTILSLNFGVFANKTNFDLSDLIAETKTHGVNIRVNFNSDNTCDIIVNNNTQFKAQINEYENSIGLKVDPKRFNGLEYLYFDNYYIVDYLCALKYVDLYIEAGYKIDKLRYENELLKKENEFLKSELNREED